MSSGVALKAGAVVALVLLAGILAVSIVTVIRVYDIKTDNGSGSNNSNNNGNNGTNPTSPTNIANPTTGNSTAYQQAAQFFAASINTAVNPCDDFYQYSCGRYNDSMSFDIATTENYLVMAKAYEVNDPSDPLPVKLAKKMYAQCLADKKDPNTIPQGGKTITAIIDSYSRKANIKWPLMGGADPAWPTATGLAQMIGVLSGSFGVETLTTSFVDTNWREPEGSNPYLYYLDQPTLLNEWTYYIGNTWTSFTQKALTERLSDYATKYAAILNIKLDKTVLAKDIADVLNFEYLLANNYSTDATTRWQSRRSYNLISVENFQKTYSFLDYNTYITAVTAPANSDVPKKMLRSDFVFSVNEPQRLQQLNNAFMSNWKTGGLTPRILSNYMFFRLIDSNSGYFPQPTNASLFLDYFERYKPSHGRQRFIRNRRRNLGKSVGDASVDLKLNCVDDTVNQMQYVNARVFVLAKYPTASDRQALRDSVGKIVESILVGMQSMIDQLSWMSPTSKTNAYSKIRNLIRNIGYPDFVLDDGQLTRYYQDLTDFSNTTSYFTITKYLEKFNARLTFQPLLRSKNTQRNDWNGPPGIVNAWYQPELNSISFPLAILRQPFFDPNWPASVNFGAMGVIAGHELSHGFDSSGTQWNGYGELFGWLDATSQTAFDNMTSCVVNEYNGFCPLDANKYSPNCINGKQTVGENVADNGGIHSAFRAYRNAINYFGPDPRLPGDLISQFSHDQLFFLSFAQVWCQTPPDPDVEFVQLLVDPHSPSKYRVFGSIQNFPAFRTAYHCKVGSTYAPQKHCNVWISDVNITQATAAPNDVNVRPPVVANNNTISKEYNKYSQAQHFLKVALNLSADPCNDFYNYACGNYLSPLSFTVYRNRNNKIMAGQLEVISSPGYQGGLEKSAAIKTMTKFYTQCKAVRSNMTNWTKDGSVVTAVFNEFAAYTGLNFNWFTNTPVAKPDGATLAKALAFLSIKYNVHTFVTPSTDTNPTRAKYCTGYCMYYDQNTLTYDKSYYQEGIWNKTKEKLYNNIYSLLNNYGKSINASSGPSEAVVSQIVNLEHMLATVTYSAPDNKRRLFLRWVNPVKVGGINVNFMDWNVYTSSISTLSGANFLGTTAVQDYNILLSEPEMMHNFASYYSTADGDLIVKYFYYRLLLSQSDFVYSVGAITGESAYERVVHETETIGQKRPVRDPFIAPINVDGVAVGCAVETMNQMQYANARVFTEYLYPTEDSRQKIQNETMQTIIAIKNSMQNMLDDLPWLDPVSSAAARGKIDNLIINIAYPPWILDNGALDLYYSKLDLSNSDNYFTSLKLLNVFNSFLIYDYLNKPTVNRQDFLGPPATVNAWYQPELNSITIPEGILQPPYFDPDWPASMRFGALGLVVGHEITHGYDDEGVQWDGNGVLANRGSWMTTAATKAFKDMAQCVITEYGNFQPLPNSFSPNKLNGENTQGENIADNGGIHSSFRSYRKFMNLRGPDPRLPDKILSQFSHDQLFFLSFAQVWCQPTPLNSVIQTQILVDPHSPSKYRVWGTLQNFPAFRNAFNCPQGSSYAPKDHCSVWVPKI